MIANAGQALATTTISTGRTTPIATATANNGAPDDIDISSGGSITLATGTTGPAVTLNSHNVVSNEGTISFTDTSNAIGILANGGQTGSVTNNGSITIKESSSPGDTNSDGVVEAPFAKTNTGDYGILVQGGAPFVGDVLNDSAGAIQITGKNSFGISVESALTGNLTNNGTISITGDSSVALREIGGVSGNVVIGGSVTAVGQNAKAVVLSGDIAGRLSFYGSVTATGYGTTSRSTVDATQTTIQNTLSEVQQGGSTITIAGNVAGGVFFSSRPANTATTSTADVDGDGVTDASQGTSTVAVYGSAPALVIGAAGRDVALGAVQLTTTPANPYGLILGGTLSAAGVEDGVSATGVQIGDSSGTGTVHIAGGVSVSGSVSALAYGANSTAIHILTGSNLPTINVTGGVTASSVLPLPNATTGAATPYTGSASGILIDAGASASNLNVTGTIAATAVGTQNDAIAFRDLGGGVSTVNLTGHITATVTPPTTTTTSTGRSVALDLGANTAGVTINMSQAAQSITTTSTDSSGNATTTVTAGPVVQNTTGAAISTSVTTGSTTVTTVTPAAPTFAGDVLLGNGPNAVNILAGGITGALGLGSGSASIVIDNGGYYSGALSYTGAALSVNIVNGSLTSTNPSTLNATSLTVGANGTLNFAVDPLNNRATNFVVSGAANIVSGAKFGINLVSHLNGPQTFQLVKATSLTVGGADATLAADVPYLFAATVQSNQAAGVIDLTVRQKTAAEMALNPAESAALPAVYAALQNDTAIQSAVFGQYQRAGFLNLYDQLLPDYSGGAFHAASVASRTISRLTAEPNQIENPTGSRGAWAQQFFIGADAGRGEAAGFRAGGFGFVGGVETGGLGFGAVGATAAFTAVNISDPHSPGTNRIGMSGLEGGFYWNGETRGLTFDARVGAGYNFFSARRQFVIFDSTTSAVTLSRQTKASWSGYSLSGHFGAAYQMDIGPTFFVRPTLKMDYFRMNEGAYSERFGAGATGDAFDLSYDSRTGDEASGTASMIFGAKLGRGLIWRPQLELGVRDVFSGDAGKTTARFVGGSPFTISPVDATGPLGVARFKFKASSEYYEIGVEAGTEAKSRYAEGDAKLTVRVLF
jgi:hypothetical protein